LKVLVWTIVMAAFPGANRGLAEHPNELLETP
jgi:hypothetical protein